MKNTHERAVRIGRRTFEPGQAIPAELAKIPAVKRMFGGGEEEEQSGAPTKQTTVQPTPPAPTTPTPPKTEPKKD